MMNKQNDQIPTVDAAIGRIQAWMRLYNFPQAEMARRAKLDPTTLTGMLRDDWTPRVSTIRAIERVIEEDPRP